jgi:hypothetical protein
MTGDVQANKAFLGENLTRSGIATIHSQRKLLLHMVNIGGGNPPPPHPTPSLTVTTGQQLQN